MGIPSALVSGTLLYLLLGAIAVALAFIAKQIKMVNKDSAKFVCHARLHGLALFDT